MACRAEARQGEGWSQSRVLPSAELAYETGLSTGSIAVKNPGGFCIDSFTAEYTCSNLVCGMR